MHNRFFFILASSLLVLLPMCKKPTEPPPPPTEPLPHQTTIELQVVAVGLSSISLRVILKDDLEPRLVRLERNGETVSNFKLIVSDTVVADTGLELNRTYQYRAIRIRPDWTDTSEVLSATTLDTTSHDFVWETFTLGGAQSSTLNDVAIVNETLAYAVGEVYVNDSTGQIDPQPYNLFQWKGMQWDLLRVPLQLYNFDCSVAGSYYGRTVAVFAFDDGNMIFTDGADVVRFDGTSYSHLACSDAIRNGAFSKFWGISINDFYAVGATGTIAHYSNGTWQKLTSGTNLDFYDIWGDFNEKTGELEVLAVASNSFADPTDRVIVRILNNNTVELVGSSGSSDQLVGLWFHNGTYYSCGSGLYRSQGVVGCADTCWHQILPPLNYLEAIRGNDVNDIIVVGHFYSIIHFNGASWKQFPTRDGGKYYGVAIRNDLIIAVGREGLLPALITVGRRN